MNEQIQELFFNEVNRGRLNFDSDPEYARQMAQSSALFPGGDLPQPIFELLESANYISFAYGLKLGLRLQQWAARESLP